MNYDRIRCFVRLPCKAPVVTGHNITGNGIPVHFSAVITLTSVGDYPQGTGHYTLRLQQGHCASFLIELRTDVTPISIAFSAVAVAEFTLQNSITFYLIVILK